MVLLCLSVRVSETHLCLKCAWVVLNYYLLMSRTPNESIKGKLVAMASNSSTDIEPSLFVS